MKFVLVLLLLIASGCYPNSTKKSSREIEKDTITSEIKKTKILKFDKIENTKWIDDLGNNCINYLQFNEQKKLEIYNCELGIINNGTYKFLNDTISFSENGYMCENCDSLIVVSTGKYIIRDEFLVLIEYNYYDEKLGGLKPTIINEFGARKYRLAQTL
jgi:hypothetical protein